MKRNAFKLAMACIALVVIMLAIPACRTEEEVPVAPATPVPATPAPEATAPPDAPEPDSGIPAFMNPIGDLPIVNEPVTLSVFTGNLSGHDYTTNLATGWFEERTGVLVDWVQVPDVDRETRLNLMLATGDVPDIIVGGAGGHARVFFYAQLGLFVPISDYINDFAPELQRLFATHPNIHDDMIMPDGKIYAFPAVDDCFHCTMGEKLWIYTPWLENLGLEMPRTIEEFYDVLVAFRDGDPNGDGGEVIPFMGANGARNRPEILISSWIPNNQGNRIIVENGVVTPVFNTPEWRDGLRFMRRLVDEDLLASESFVQDRASLQHFGNNPDVNIVGVAPALWISNFVVFNVAEQDGRWNNWRMIPPLVGPDGFVTATYSPLRGNNIAVITSTLPEELMPVAVRWLDNFLTQESSLIAIQGYPDILWRYSDPGEVGIHGGPALWERIVPPEPVENVRMHQIMPNWRSHDFRLSERANRTIVEQETLLFDMSMIQLPYRQPIEQVLPILIFDEAQTAEMVDLEVTINTFVIENIARFSVGDICIEDDWDWYVRELEVMGLNRMIEILQTAFDERQARIAAAS